MSAAVGRPLSEYASRADYNVANSDRFWSRVSRGDGSVSDTPPAGAET